MNTQTVDKSATSPSRRDIDWLRVLATLTIFLFRCARSFDTMDWHLKNPQRSDVGKPFRRTCPQIQKPTLSDNTRTGWGRRRPWLLAR